MGVLIPPLPRMSVPTSKDAYTYAPSLIYEETTSPRLGDVSSPDGTPAPAGEASYQLHYSYGYSWPQSDVRSVPHVQSQYGAVAAAAEPRYLPTYRNRIPSAAYSYNV